MFEDFPNTCCCSQKFPPNKIENLACCTYKVVSEMFIVSGQWEMEYQAKFIVQNGVRARVKLKSQSERAVLAP